MNQTILKKFSVSENDFLGEGGEAWVYKLDQNRILKLYKNNDLNKNMIGQQRLLARLKFQQLQLSPLAILKWDVVDNTLYSIEKRVEGIDLSKSLQKLQGAERVAALDSFYEGAMKISKLYESKRCYFKEAIHANGYPRSKHWPTFLAGVACKTLFRKFSNLERKELLEIFATRCGNINYSKAPELVHFDYFPANVIEYEGRVVAVIDYSLAIFGDPLLDVAGAVGYLPLEDRVTDRDYKHLLKMMFDHHTKEDITTMTTYLIYMAIYWSGCDSSRVAEWSAVIIDAWRKDNYKGSDTAIWEAITPKAKIKREGARYVSDM